MLLGTKYKGDDKDIWFSLEDKSDAGLETNRGNENCKETDESFPQPASWKHASNGEWSNGNRIKCNSPVSSMMNTKVYSKNLS